ncbi:argininosuccinate lyase [Cytobacillus sp. S13-E01]|uniref:argininosuccinate lyase n=1 Tax=Cytobacillus sp. S13-E01 TaxID=3031326 RepID=UPI0023D7E3A4|nr:argininosuccinate lyase [Cytobacillus sp. S13-E01]MDF0726324.1 argininosuccinate lyase [Cytobacillus sp. S13-E01]
MTKRSQLYVKSVLTPIFEFTREHFYSYILEISIVHVSMLGKQGILPEESVGKIIEACGKLLETDYQKEYDSEFEDLFFMIEHDLKESIGDELVGNMHIAFSRNDMDATMFRMFWREHIIEWFEQIDQLIEVLLKIADEHKDTIIPAYTHNQQAQPTTLAHYIIAVVHHLERDLERGTSLFERINVSPMGAAALGTTGFPIDRDYVADHLGFAKAMENSYDAIAAADYMLELASVLITSLSSLSRFVYDLMLLTTNEVKGMTIHSSLVQTSSIMPQKRNPSSLEHTRSYISRTIGELQAVFPMSHSVPFGDIVDIGDDIQPILYNGITETKGIVALLSEILENTTFHKEELYNKCKNGFSTVTELADVLVRNHQLSFRESHQITQRFVGMLFEKNQVLLDGNAGIINRLAKEIIGKNVHLSETEYEAAIDPIHFVAVRSVKGGPMPAETTRQIELSRLRVIDFNKQVNEKKDTIRKYQLDLTNLMNQTANKIKEGLKNER